MARIFFSLCLVSFLLVLVGIAGVRYQFLPLKIGLLGASGLSLLMILLAALSLLVILVKTLTGGATPGQYWATLVLGGLPLLFFLVTVGPKGFRAPVIHDITTDTDNPPALEFAARHRDAGDHPVDYQGAVVAGIQEEAYPAVEPLVVPVPPEQALTQARELMADLGWEVLGVDEDARRVEAVVRSGLFLFEDDVAVRITPVEQGSRIDVRSASRVGRGDLGANAQRVLMLLDRLRERLG